MRIHRLIHSDPHYDYTDTVPFVFASDPNNPEKHIDEIPEEDLALPYKKCFFEYEGDAAFNIMDVPNHPDVTVRITAVFIEEISPREYLLKTLASVRGNAPNGIKGTKVFTFTNKGVFSPEKQEYDQKSDGIATYQFYLGAVNDLIQRMYQHKSGIGNITTKEKSKYRVNGVRHTYKPSQYIYVSATDRSKKLPKTKRNITWFTTFPVRGHWRKLHNPSSIGLDRQNNRCIQGFTWINSYKKGSGPERESKIYKINI